MSEKRKILLHVCCGPCATASIERLLSDGWEVDLFFSNSNLASIDEYYLRLEAAEKTAEHFGLKLTADEYDHDAWLDAVKGLEAEPEKGGRCSVCFAFSLERTARAAESDTYDGFTTSLSISPHKNSSVIFSNGRAAGDFIEYNFKKNEGFKRSIELSEQLDLYRQDFCGCEFSIRTAKQKNT